MVIYDCFTFFNELDLLELRLHELNPVVDRFVLVEATKTHSGKPKPLYFNENRSRYREFLPKIEHVVVDDMPEVWTDRWELENFQRNAIMRGLSNCKPDDVIIISDADEIVSAAAVAAHKNVPGIKIFEQRLFYYFLNCLCTTSGWDRAKMLHYKDMLTPQRIRSYPKPAVLNPTRFQRKLARLKHRIRQKFGARDVVVKNGGWHFSYLGNAEHIAYKLQSFAHSECDTENFRSLERIQEILDRGGDLYGRGMKFSFVPLDNGFPRYLLDHREKFESLIRKV